MKVEIILRLLTKFVMHSANDLRPSRFMVRTHDMNVGSMERIPM